VFKSYIVFLVAGRSLLQRDSSFTDDGNAVETVQVEIERFGPDENNHSCVAKVSPDNTYLFFLSPASSGDRSLSSSQLSSSSSSLRAASDMPLLVNTAMPKHMDQQVVRQVNDEICIVKTWTNK
jgi:hypothetical protein